MASWLIPAIAGWQAAPNLQSPPEGTTWEDLTLVADLIFAFLRRSNGNDMFSREALEILVKMPSEFIEIPGIVSIVQSNPELLESVPGVRQLPGFQSLWDDRER
jgi:hypothetical protein